MKGALESDQTKSSRDRAVQVPAHAKKYEAYRFELNWIFMYVILQDDDDGDRDIKKRIDSDPFPSCCLGGAEDLFRRRWREREKEIKFN